MNYSNNAFSVLNGDISATDTAITLATGTGARFPSSNFNVTLIGYDGLGNEASWEICLCSSRSGDVLTVSRGQEGTTAAAWPGATRIEARLTAGAAAEMATKSGTETLTNKTLTNPTINGMTGGTQVIDIGSGQLYKDTSGNIGIGTATPGSLYSMDHLLAMMKNQNGTTRVTLVNNTVGANAAAAFKIIGGSPNSFFDLGLSDSNGAPYAALSTGAGVLRLAFSVGGGEAARIDSSKKMTVYGDLEARSLNGGQLAGMRNKIINGKMEIAQRGTNFAFVNLYTLDRWYVQANVGAATASQQNDVPSGDVFQTSLRFAVTSSASLGTTGDIRIQHIIEGYNVRDLVGRSFVLSFWVRSSKTGIHCVSFANDSGDRSYVAEYTVNAANTWEKKSVTVNGGLITAGTWNWLNGVGLRCRWSLGSGTNLHTAANVWQTGNFLATPSQVNCLDTVGNIFAITGVQLEVGSVATPFEHRPYGLELALCQRYLPAITGGDANMVGVASANSSTLFYVDCKLPVTARVRPTGITASAGNIITVESATNTFVSSSINATLVSSVSNSMLAVSVAGATAGRAGIAYFNGNAGAGASILFTGCEL